MTSISHTTEPRTEMTSTEPQPTGKPSILRVLREGGVVLVSRIAGLLLSAIAVQLIADAVRAFIAGEG